MLTILLIYVFIYPASYFSFLEVHMNSFLVLVSSPPVIQECVDWMQASLFIGTLAAGIYAGGAQTMSAEARFFFRWLLGICLSIFVISIIPLIITLYWVPRPA